MRAMRRLMPLVLLAALVAVAAVPAAAGAKKTCKNPTPVKVGNLCVKQSTFDGKGNYALLVPVRERGKPPKPGVRVQLRGSFERTCSDGTKEPSGFPGLASPIAALSGKRFSAKITDGPTSRELRGRFTASNKVLIELYRKVEQNAAGALCTTEVRNVTITGK